MHIASYIYWLVRPEITTIFPLWISNPSLKEVLNEELLMRIKFLWKNIIPKHFIQIILFEKENQIFACQTFLKKKKHIRKYVKYKDRLYPIHRNFKLFRRYLNLQAIKLNEYIYIYFEYVLSINGTFYFLVYIVM